MAYSRPVSADLGVLYRNARMRVGAMVSDASGDTRVPATPLWTVHDVVAHLGGVVDDVLAGNMEGVTTDPWTAAQVERGRSKTVAQMLASWNEGAPVIEGFLSTPDGAAAYRAVLDVHTHEADLQNALGHPLQLPADFVEWMEPVMLANFEEAVAVAGLESIQVDIPAVELFRSRLGRRTVAEVMAYSWSADPTPYLDAWFLFGRAEQSLGEV
jgi:uncharacterized protein (TIGR03083 family)